MKFFCSSEEKGDFHLLSTLIVQFEFYCSSWPTLRIEELNNKNVKELLRAEMASQGRTLTEQQESRILTHCRSPQTTAPLYVVVLASELAK